MRFGLIATIETKYTVLKNFWCHHENKRTICAKILHIDDHPLVVSIIEVSALENKCMRIFSQ